MSRPATPTAPLWVTAAAAVCRRLPRGRYRIAARLPRSPGRFLARLPRRLGGALFECDLRDGISREACFCGIYAPGETALVRNALGPGGIFVDVGANWGYFSLIAATRVGPGGRVVALEPDPRLLPLLRANLVHNGLTQVTALGVAAAAHHAEVEMLGFDWRDGNSGLTRIALPGDTSSGPRFTVPGDTLARILDRLRVESVDLLKMDIEGAELFALEGLRPVLIPSRIRKLLIEIHPGHLAALGSDPNRAVEPLLAAGYQGYDVDVRRHRLPVPLDPSRPPGPWPHQLWTAPGVAPDAPARGTG